MEAMSERSFQAAARLAIVLAALAATGCVVARPTPVVYEPPPPAVAVFRDSLAPYGQWIVVERFGSVWRPHPWMVGADFEPYSTGGYWVSTDAGWTFATHWPWGWAAFHYGRWYRDSAFGWVWAPDTVWAPAWVEWRFGGGYVGWAPLPPPGVTTVYRSYSAPWVFVPAPYFVQPEPRRYALQPGDIHRAFAVTRQLHPSSGGRGAAWHVGPPPSQVATAAGHPVSSVPLSAPPPPPGEVRPVTVAPPHTASTAPPGSHFGPKTEVSTTPSSPAAPIGSGHSSSPSAPGATVAPPPSAPQADKPPPATAPPSSAPPSGHPLRRPEQ
jgi:hypothetical protein